MLYLIMCNAILHELFHEIEVVKKLACVVPAIKNCFAIAGHVVHVSDPMGLPKSAFNIPEFLLCICCWHLASHPHRLSLTKWSFC